MKKLISIILGIVFLFMIVPVVFANTSPKLTNGGAQPPFITPGTTVIYIELSILMKMVIVLVM